MAQEASNGKGVRAVPAEASELDLVTAPDATDLEEWADALSQASDTADLDAGPSDGPPGSDPEDDFAPPGSDPEDDLRPPADDPEDEPFPPGEDPDDLDPDDDPAGFREEARQILGTGNDADDASAPAGAEAASPAAAGNRENDAATGSHGTVPDDLVHRVELILASGKGREVKLERIARLLADRVPHYNWVGFYLVDPSSPRELVLGPYVGAPTDHVRIPFGRGICGQAAERGETFVVQDVSKEENYLSCSVDVMSEIVVPIVADGRIVAEIDIDSHVLAPFTKRDRAVLEEVAGLVAELF